MEQSLKIALKIENSQITNRNELWKENNETVAQENKTAVVTGVHSS